MCTFCANVFDLSFSKRLSGYEKKELSLGTAGMQADRTEQTLSLPGRTLFARKPLPPWATSK